jgi:hypothetical protein
MRHVPDQSLRAAGGTPSTPSAPDVVDGQVEPFDSVLDAEACLVSVGSQVGNGSDVGSSRLLGWAPSSPLVAWPRWALPLNSAAHRDSTPHLITRQSAAYPRAGPPVGVPDPPTGLIRKPSHRAVGKRIQVSGGPTDWRLSYLHRVGRAQSSTRVGASDGVMGTHPRLGRSRPEPAQFHPRKLDETVCCEHRRTRP